MNSDNKSIPRAVLPEEVGVSSKAIVEFLDDMEKSGMDYHSFMVIRHGKVAAECYRAPFTAGRPHAMYSVSKTVTATAIALAVQEGFLSLSDKVKDFFPDYTEKLNDKYLETLTVEHLVTMTSGKDPSVFADKSKGNWMEYYFSSPWYNEPGKEFRYINENIYMLSAIIKRATGLCMREFLRPRLFEPLGIDYPFWETDSYGIEAGGWGLYLKTEDLAKIMLTYANGGIYNGERILTEEWVKFASEERIDTPRETDADAAVGYGCCLWRCKYFNGYRADGLFSQFGIVFEDYDAVLVVTSAIAQQQVSRDFLWKYFPAAFIDENSKEDTSYPGLKEKLESAVIDILPRLSDSSYEEKIQGCEIHFRKKIFLNLIGFPMSMLPLAVTYMTTDKAGNIDKMSFRFGKTDCTVTWSEGDETNTIPLGLDGRYRYGTMRLGQIDYKVCSTAQWLERDRLYLQIRPIETISKRNLNIKFFENGKVKMKPSSEPGIYTIAMSLAGAFESLVGNKKISDKIIPLFRFGPNLLEPTLKGKIKYNK
ncbi:MAG: serine hydrolase [Clostridia bacterium]|nr:serine hydrolase [Clostridia bacterium]